MNKPKVIVICGPTASGKTALSIELAKKINGEIISCDSMQIYKDMNIGTAKPTTEEMQGIKHYLLDFVEPNKRISLNDLSSGEKQIVIFFAYLILHLKQNIEGIFCLLNFVSLYRYLTILNRIGSNCSK